MKFRGLIQENVSYLKLKLELLMNEEVFVSNEFNKIRYELRFPNFGRFSVFVMLTLPHYKSN